MNNSAHIALIIGTLSLTNPLAAAAADSTADFLSAVLHGNVHQVEAYKAQQGNINVTDTEGHTALIIAAGCGYYDIVKLLLKAKADTQLRDSDGCTALMRAQRRNNRGICELLTQKNN